MLSPATTASTATHRRSVESSSMRALTPSRRTTMCVDGYDGSCDHTPTSTSQYCRPGIVTDRTCPPSDSDPNEDADSGEIVRDTRPCTTWLDPASCAGWQHRNLARATPLHRNVEQAILQLFHQTPRGSANLVRPSIALARHRGDNHSGHAQTQGTPLRHLDCDAIHGGTLGRRDDNPLDVTTGQRIGHGLRALGQGGLGG